MFRFLLESWPTLSKFLFWKHYYYVKDHQQIYLISRRDCSLLHGSTELTNLFHVYKHFPFIKKRNTHRKTRKNLSENVCVSCYTLGSFTKSVREILGYTRTPQHIMKIGKQHNKIIN